jgi:hypothetical protein
LLPCVWPHYYVQNEEEGYVDGLCHPAIHNCEFNRKKCVVEGKCEKKAYIGNDYELEGKYVYSNGKFLQ